MPIKTYWNRFRDWYDKWSDRHDILCENATFVFVGVLVVAMMASCVLIARTLFLHYPYTFKCIGAWLIYIGAWILGIVVASFVFWIIGAIWLIFIWPRIERLVERRKRCE